jgi:hypothetical protein
LLRFSINARVVPKTFLDREKFLWVKGANDKCRVFAGFLGIACEKNLARGPLRFFDCVKESPYCCIIHHQYAAPLAGTAYSPRSGAAAAGKSLGYFYADHPYSACSGIITPQYGRTCI